jgi:hypothetical protein
MNIVSPTAQLVVLRQNSLVEEKLIKNGQPKAYHIVVKNSPFLVQLGLTSRNPTPAVFFSASNKVLDIAQYNFEAKLFYDIEGDKEVSWVKEKPMECKIHPNDHQPGTLTAEVRIKVLSTQHEDLFFKVKFTAIDKATKRETFCTYSAPIKVISKSDQVKKKKQPKQKKRTLTDILVDTLTSIEKRQQEQCELLASILGVPVSALPMAQSMSFPQVTSTQLGQSEPLSDTGLDLSGGGAQDFEIDSLDDEEDMGALLTEASEGMNFLPSSPSSSSPPQQFPTQLAPARFQVGVAPTTTTTTTTTSTTNMSAPQLNNLDPTAVKKAKFESTDPSGNFGQAFKDFLLAFDALKPDERKETLQRTMVHEGSSIALELLDMFWTEGLQREPRPLSSEVVASHMECHCLECPYKDELVRIEDFYKDVFSLTTNGN